MTEPDDDLTRILTDTWKIDPDPRRLVEARAEAIAAAGPRSGSLRRRLAAAALVATTGVLGTGAAAVATSDALPDGPGYAVKRGLEHVRVALAFGPEAETRVWLDLADTRVDEAERASDEGRDEIMDEILDGYVDAVSEAHHALDAVAATDADAAVLSEADAAFADHLVRLDALAGQLPIAALPGLERAREAAGAAELAIPPVAPHDVLPPAGIPAAPGPAVTNPAVPGPSPADRPPTSPPTPDPSTARPPVPAPTGTAGTPDELPTQPPASGNPSSPGHIPGGTPTLSTNDDNPPKPAAKGEGQ